MHTIYTTQQFDTWFSNLKDRQAAKRIQARIDRTEDGNLGDCEAVGGGVSEIRIHFCPGYRIYFIKQGIEIIVLLAGGDKSSQAKDIKTAHELARKL